MLSVLLAAFLLVGALPSMALAVPKEGTLGPKQGTFTVSCPEFETGYSTFTQRLPTAAGKVGSPTSLEHSAGGGACID